MKILITGGTGYIGSHTVVELLETGHEVVIIDDLSNSSDICVSKIQSITGKSPLFYKGSINNKSFLDNIFTQHNIDSVIHFAGSKILAESIKKPISYYQNNIQGTLTLLEAMKNAHVFKLIFSSSAAVYGKSNILPIQEDSPTENTKNPYASSKLMIEIILEDIAISDPRWAFIILRYFNPVGAHSSGLIGEDPNGIPNNLLPYIAQVAMGKLKTLKVYGNNYNTPDGTGVRDYIHVVDLALAHLKALQHIKNKSGTFKYNLGTGNGYSVLDMIKAFEVASGTSIPYTIAPPRKGDIAACYAAPEKALKELNWKAERELDEMMQDTWRWQSSNPNGYKSK